MRETILAVLALSVVTTMSLGIMSTSIQNSIKQIDREIEVYGSAVAGYVMDYVGSLSYDERTIPENWENQSEVGDDSEFAAFVTFGQSPDCNLFEPYKDVVICDDIGDVHMGNRDWQLYNYLVEVVNGDSLVIPFEVNTQVTYVDPANPDSTLPPSAKTKTKKVVVTVQSVQHRLDNLFGGKVTIERLYSYDKDLAAAHLTAAAEVCDGSNTLKVNPLLVPIYERRGASSGPCP